MLTGDFVTAVAFAIVAKAVPDGIMGDDGEEALEQVCGAGWTSLNVVVPHHLHLG